MFIQLAILVLLNVANVHNHAFLSEPPSRASAWLSDPDFFDCCRNYNYNQMFCGGTTKMWLENGGRCGICGDAWDTAEPRDYEKGGVKYLGKVVRSYAKNALMPVTVQITANHLGFFEFRLCNIDGWSGDATQACLNKTVLSLVSPSGEATSEQRYPISADMKRVELTLRLPTNLTCDHCLLQWKYVTGNSWGTDDDTNRSCLGCGVIQEHFYSCADIAIIDESAPRITVTGTSKSVDTTTTQMAAVAATAAMTATNTAKTPFKCASKVDFGGLTQYDDMIGSFCARVCSLYCNNSTTATTTTAVTSNDIEPNGNGAVCKNTCPVLCECS